MPRFGFIFTTRFFFYEAAVNLNDETCYSTKLDCLAPCWNIKIQNCTGSKIAKLCWVFFPFPWWTHCIHHNGSFLRTLNISRRTCIDALSTLKYQDMTCRTLAQQQSSRKIELLILIWISILSHGICEKFHVNLERVFSLTWLWKTYWDPKIT